MGTRSLSNPRFTVTLSATVRNQLTDNTVVSVAHPALNYAPSLANGIGANQANRGWQSLSRSLGSGASETLDLFDMAGVDIGAGAGLDGVGQAVSPFEEIVAIAIVNNNAIGAAGQLEIEPDAANGWSPIGTHTAANGGALRGQGVLIKGQPAASGFDITDASSHRIQLTANGAAVTYSIYLLARHDDEESSSSTTPSSSSSSPSTSSSISSSSSVSSSSSSSISSSSSSPSSSSPSSSSSRSVSSTSWSSPSESRSSTSTTSPTSSSSISTESSSTWSSQTL